MDSEDCEERQMLSDGRKQLQRRFVQLLAAYILDSPRR